MAETLWVAGRVPTVCRYVEALERHAAEGGLALPMSARELATGLIAAGTGMNLERLTRVHARLVERLASLGVSEPAVEVELCERLARTPGGKLQMVVADRGAPAGT